ncbi:hypothetical protein MNBD_GAMMA17-1692, partial [hydrothermal vent metagenome]
MSDISGREDDGIERMPLKTFTETAY